jgi:hypothetical protein
MRFGSKSPGCIFVEIGKHEIGNRMILCHIQSLKDVERLNTILKGGKCKPKCGKKCMPSELIRNVYDILSKTKEDYVMYVKTHSFLCVKFKEVDIYIWKNKSVQALRKYLNCKENGQSGDSILKEFDHSSKRVYLPYRFVNTGGKRFAFRII